MATLLEDILQNVFIAGTVTSRPESSHKDGCNCCSCNHKKAQAAGGHKNWKERRKARLQGYPKPFERAASAGIQSEYEWESPVPAAPVRHVVLVAGHNYTDPGNKMINLCFNRCKRLLKKDSTLHFTIFDFTGGKTIFGKLLDGKLNWRLLTQHAAITPAHYAKNGKSYTFKSDPGVLSITDVCKYIVGIGTSTPGALKELSFFGHGWQDGRPVLINSFDLY